MKIQAKDLWQLLYNAILFTDKKSAAGGVAQFEITGPNADLLAVATDDHVAIVDSLHLGVADLQEFFLPLDVMKALEKDLRDQVGEIDWDPDVLAAEAVKGDEDLFGVVRRMLSLKDFVSDDSVQHVTFALNPDRLRKFSLLKPGDFPIDMRYGYDTAIGRDLVAFKAGPTLRGVLAPLDRKLLAEKFGEEAGSVMW